MYRLVITHFMRAFRSDLQRIGVTEPERRSLAAAGVGDDTLQKYLCWRRSVLWVVVLPTLLSAVLFTASQLAATRRSTTLGGMVLVLDILSRYALPVSAVCAALSWRQPRLSSRLSLWGWAVSFLFPMTAALLPLEWLTDLGDWPEELRELARTLLGIAYAVALAPVILSLLPGVMRACVRVKFLLPDSSLAGWFLVGTAPLYVAAQFIPLILVNQVVGNPILFAAMFVFVTTPLVYSLGGRLFIEPLTPERRRRMAWLTGTGSLMLLGSVALFLSYATGVRLMGMNLVGWRSGTAILSPAQLPQPVIEYLGRSLFLTLVAADFLLRASLSARAPVESSRGGSSGGTPAVPVADQ